MCAVIEQQKWPPRDAFTEMLKIQGNHQHFSNYFQDILQGDLMSEKMPLTCSNLS